MIHQVTISANSTKQTFCTVTKGGSETRGNAIPTSSAVIDTTRAGNGSTASGAPAITLSPNELLAFTWTGGNAGDTATAAIHYQILEA